MDKPKGYSPAVAIDRCVCQRALFADLLPLAIQQEWTLEQLITNTGCGAQCGMCVPYLRRMFADGTILFHDVIPLDDEVS